MEKRVESWTHLADNRILNWAVRLAPIHNMLTMFDPLPSDNEEEEKPDGTTEAGK